VTVLQACDYIYSPMPIGCQADQHCRARSRRSERRTAV